MSEEPNALLADRRAVLLVEYQKTQDSAEHHDRLVGSVTSLWLASAVLVGFVLNALTSTHPARFKTPLGLVIGVGILLNVLAISWVWRALRIKQQKYARCKALEQILGMNQHLAVAKARWWQPVASWVLMALLLATWVVLFVDVVRL